MQFVRADTATKVVIGPVVAVGDGFVPVTTLAVGTADEAEIIKHDAAAVTDISGRTFAAIANADGYYNLSLIAGDVDTEGRLKVLINDDSLVLPVDQDIMVMNQNAFDSLYAVTGTDLLSVNLKELNDDATAAIRLALSAAAIEVGACEGTPSTSVIQTDLAEAQDDIYIGAVVIFTSGAARGERTDITDYVGATGTITVTPLANAPAAADTFVLI